MSTYSDMIAAEPTVLHYWPMGETSGTSLASLVGGTTITLGTSTAKPTLGVAGQVGNAVRFDGVNDTASVALNLSAYNKIVVEWWMSWDIFVPNDKLAMEFTSNYNGSSGGFIVDPNAGSAFYIGLKGDANYSDANYARPTAATPHHYAARFDKSAVTNEVDLFIDGVLLTPTGRTNNNNTNTFANSTLTIMNRADGSLPGAGWMQHLAFHSDLSTTRILAHSNLGFGLVSASNLGALGSFI